MGWESSLAEATVALQKSTAHQQVEQKPKISFASKKTRDPPLYTLCNK